MDLQRLLDPLQESDVYGIDLFIQARDFISNYAHLILRNTVLILTFQIHIIWLYNRMDLNIFKYKFCQMYTCCFLLPFTNP